MKKMLIIFVLVALAGGIGYVLITHPGVFSKIYLWVIGLFGIITWPFRKLWDWVNSNDELKEIEQSNTQLKQELQQIKKDLALAQSKLQQEREKNRIRIEKLEENIRQEGLVGNSIKQELAVLKGQSISEFKGALTPEEGRKVHDEMWKEVDFGL
jgi:peptidoglycan hydrolase CwlO-like protein